MSGQPLLSQSRASMTIPRTRNECIREQDNKDEWIEPKGFSSAERKREIYMRHFLSCSRTAQ